MHFTANVPDCILKRPLGHKAQWPTTNGFSCYMQDCMYTGTHEVEEFFSALVVFEFQVFFPLDNHCVSMLQLLWADFPLVDYPNADDKLTEVRPQIMRKDNSEDSWP